MIKLTKLLIFTSLIFDSLGSVTGKFSLIIKLILIGCFTLSLVKKNISRTVILISVFLGISTFYKFLSIGPDQITELSWFFRIILVLLTIEFSKRFLDKNFIQSYFILLFIILLFSISLSFIYDFGTPMYKNERIGTRAFYIAGNELSFLLIVVTTFQLIRLGTNSRFISFALVSLLSVAIAIMLSTKVALIGVIIVILICLQYLLSRAFSFKNLKINRKQTFALLPFLIILFWSIPYIFDFVLNQVGLLKRIEYAINRFDPLTVLMSGRNEKIMDMLYYLINQDIGNIIFGLGEKRMINLFGQTTESDFFDFLGFYGIFGVLSFLVYIFYLFSQIRSSKPYKRGFILFILISVLGGHVFSSGVAAVSLGLFISNIFHENYNNNWGKTSDN